MEHHEIAFCSLTMLTGILLEVLQTLAIQDGAWTVTDTAGPTCHTVLAM